MRRIFRARDYQPHADKDLDDELQCHLALKVEDLMARGMSQEEARPFWPPSSRPGERE